MRVPVLVVLTAVLSLATACSGRSCDELPGLQAERSAARAAYLELARSGTVPPAQTERADADLHLLEKRVLDVELECAER